MSKPFFEVFPNLKLNTDIHDLMGQTEVERVSATKRRDFLRVYLKSTRLIQKADIWTAEQEIKKQLFPDANLTVKIYEKFELSSQYNPEKLMDIYKESILEEFREYSHIQYNALKTARIEYPADNEMLITMEDTVLNRSMEGEILQILEKILVERCGFSVKLHAAYVEKEAGRFKEEEEAKIRMKVDAIYSRTRGRKEETVDSTAPAQDTEQENTQSPEAKKTDNSGKAKSEPAGGVTKSFQGGGRGEFKRGEFKGACLYGLSVDIISESFGVGYLMNIVVDICSVKVGGKRAVKHFVSAELIRNNSSGRLIESNVKVFAVYNKLRRAFLECYVTDVRSSLARQGIRVGRKCELCSCVFGNGFVYACFGEFSE